MSKNKKKAGNFFKTFVLLALIVIISIFILRDYQTKDKLVNNDSKEQWSNNIFKDELTVIPTQLLNNTSNEVKCDKSVNIWSYLSPDLQKRTSNERHILTYEIYPLKWSDDCRYLPFYLELVGRGADAYSAEDFIPRGLYMYNDITKKITIIQLLDTERTIDSKEHNSNNWFYQKYIFVVTTNVKKSQILKARYSYDVSTGFIRSEGEDRY